MSRGVAIFDLDETITSRPTWTRFLVFVLKQRGMLAAGLPRLIAASAGWAASGAGREALKDLGFAVAASGLSREELTDYASAFIDRELEGGLRPGALRRIDRIKHEGKRFIIATASVHLYADILGARLGADDVVGTSIAWPEDRLAPVVDGPNCIGAAKLKKLKILLAEERDGLHIDAFSDNIADLEMLRWADHGVAVNPHRPLRRAAIEHGLPIEDWSR